MARKEYLFKIEAYSPDTIPMERLGQYMADLGAMLGDAHNVHFVRLQEGSTGLLHAVEAEAVPKIEGRVASVAAGKAEPTPLNAFRSLNKRLKEDNATASYGERGATANLLFFPGITEPEPPQPSVVVQAGSIDGVVIRLGGKDNTVPVQIQDGETVYRCTTSRDVARLLGPYIFGEEIRLNGEGKWIRTADGEWSLELFKIQSFESLSGLGLVEAVAEIRSIDPDWNGSTDVWDELIDLRGE